MSSTEQVEIEVVIVDETNAAYVIANPDEDVEWRNWIWLPKRQVTLEDPYVGAPTHQTTMVTMPEWLAMEKGLI